jgi:GNAT superfamily N-acetyltransferase
MKVINLFKSIGTTFCTAYAADYTKRHYFSEPVGLSEVKEVRTRKGETVYLFPATTAECFPGQYVFAACLRDPHSGAYVPVGGVTYSCPLGTDKVSKFVELNSIAVDKKYQGRGIGSAMLSAVARQAVNAGKGITGEPIYDARTYYQRVLDYIPGPKLNLAGLMDQKKDGSKANTATISSEPFALLQRCALFGGALPSVRGSVVEDAGGLTYQELQDAAQGICAKHGI